MPNYQKGKIYTIRSKLREDLIYVGSTTRKLSQRLREHKIEKNTRSKIIIELGDTYIELYENYPCNCKEELTKREGEIIRLLECVNKRIEMRTPKERYNDNKEEILEKRREYYQDNKEKCLKNIAKYYQDNKESRKAYAKEIYNKNKTKILEKNKIKYTCECGSTLRKVDKKRHEKTKKHKKFISL